MQAPGEGSRHLQGWVSGGHGLQSEPQAPGTPGEHHCPLSLEELQNFIKESTAGLSKPLEEGDYDGLVEVMAHLAKVRERQEATDMMFEPLKETVALLKTYGDKMPEEIHLLLQVGCWGVGGRAGARWGRAGDPACCPLQKLPESWDNNKKLCLRVAESAAPLQAAEAAIIRSKCQDFEVPAGAGAALDSPGRTLLLLPAARPWLPSRAPCSLCSHTGPAARLPGELPGKCPFLIHRTRALQVTEQGEEGEGTSATAVPTGTAWPPLTLAAGEGQLLQGWLQLPG